MASDRRGRQGTVPSLRALCQTNDPATTIILIHKPPLFADAFAALSLHPYNGDKCGARTVLLTAVSCLQPQGELQEEGIELGSEDHGSDEQNALMQAYLRPCKIAVRPPAELPRSKVQFDLSTFL